MNHTVKNVFQIISILLFAFVLRWLLIGDWLNKLALENNYSFFEVIHLIGTSSILYFLYTLLTSINKTNQTSNIINKNYAGIFLLILGGTIFNILLLYQKHSVISMLIYPISLMWILNLIFRNKIFVDYKTPWYYAFGIVILSIYLISLEVNSLISATQTFYIFSKQQWFNIALMIPQLYFLGVMGFSISLFSKYTSKNIDTISEFSSNMVLILILMVGFLTFSVVYQFNDINIWKLIACIIPILLIEIYLFNQFSENKCVLNVNWLYTIWGILILLILLYFKWNSFF
jgi:hypothetical protein